MNAFERVQGGAKGFKMNAFEDPRVVCVYRGWSSHGARGGEHLRPLTGAQGPIFNSTSAPTRRPRDGAVEAAQDRLWAGGVARAALAPAPWARGYARLREGSVQPRRAAHSVRRLGHGKRLAPPNSAPPPRHVTQRGRCPGPPAAPPVPRRAAPPDTPLPRIGRAASGRARRSAPRVSCPRVPFPCRPGSD